MSEMFIPTSVYEQARQLNYGVFELIDAATIHEMMKDIFVKRHGIENNYVVDPFCFKIQFGLRNSYDMRQDNYKYRVKIIN